MSSTKIADAINRPWLLERLLREPGRNAWAIQDLQQWPERTKLYFRQPDHEGARLDYLLLTGHPGAQTAVTIVLDGSPEGVKPLLQHVPTGSWLARETPADLLPTLQALAPDAKAYLEQRMEVTRATFIPAHKGSATRRLVEGDALALAKFKGAPERAAPGFVQWIRGAWLFGTWEGSELVAIASTFVRVPAVAELVSVETRPQDRGKGFATEVTSTLTKVALEESVLVSLTVLKNNEPAKALYAKLGYSAREDRIWFDNGVGSAP